MHSSTEGLRSSRALRSSRPRRLAHRQRGRCRRPARRASGRRRRACTARARPRPAATEVPMPYRLLMIWKTIGRFQIAARLSASWKAPMLVAPSPSWHRTTPRRSRLVERERRADRDRQVAADDAPAAVEAALDVEQVHRAAVAARDAGRLAEELGHHRGRIGCRRRARSRGRGSSRTGSRRRASWSIAPTCEASSPIARWQ